MKTSLRATSQTNEEEQLINQFKQQAQAMLTELKFKELVQIYRDSNPFENDAEKVVWILTEKEIEKRNSQWLKENKSVR